MSLTIVYPSKPNARRTFYGPPGIDFILPQSEKDEWSCLLGAGRAGGRMDLMIAIVHRTTILNVGGHAIDGGRRQRADGEDAVFQVRQEVAVRCSEGLPEGGRNGAEVRLLRDFDSSLPSLEAIDISWLDGTTRMAATGFTAVFDIDAEDHPFRLSRSAAADVVDRSHLPNARPDDGIGRRRTWLRPTDLVIIRIAELELVDERPAGWRDERIGDRVTATQASASQRVVNAFGSLRMEVHVEDIPRVGFTFVVADMRPLPTDTRIAEDFTAVHVAKRRTQLATVRDFLDRQAIGRSEREDRGVHLDAGLIYESRYQHTATCHPTGNRC